MMKFLKMVWIGFGILSISQMSFSEGVVTKHKKLKIPHNHASMAGGSVLMLGDYHVEIKATKKANTLELFTSDRVRDPVDANLFDLKVVLVDGAIKTPLKFEQSKDLKSKVLVDLSLGHSANASLEISASRITPIKGEVSSTSPQSIKLKDVLKSSNSRKRL